MENKQSLEVDYQLLAKECHALAYFLPEVPAQVIEIFNEAATQLVMSTFPRYSNIQVNIFQPSDNTYLKTIESNIKLTFRKKFMSESVVYHFTKKLMRYDSYTWNNS